MSVLHIHDIGLDLSAIFQFEVCLASLFIGYFACKILKGFTRHGLFRLYIVYIKEILQHCAVCFMDNDFFKPKLSLNKTYLTQIFTTFTSASQASDTTSDLIGWRCLSRWR